MKKTTSLAILILAAAANLTLAADDFKAAILTLQQAKSGTTSQVEIQQAWQVVSQSDAAKLTKILAAMREAEPIAENWLRGAVDTIAERQLRESGSLPIATLEKFVLDTDEAPRARRTAFEWLAKADPTAQERLLPQMLEDTSLELRYDAVARLLAEATEASNDAEKLIIYRRAFSTALALDQMTECVEQLEKLDKTPDLKQHFAYVTRWMIIGPFDNIAEVGMNNVYPPEEEIDYGKQYDGKSTTVSWKEYRPDANDLKNVGRVDLNSVVNEEKGAVAYAAANIYSPVAQEAQCRYETVNATELWVNGKQLASDDIYHAGGEFDQYVVPVELQKGENIILLKICQNEQTENWARPWDFRLRITDLLGAGVAHTYESEK